MQLYDTACAAWLELSQTFRSLKHRNYRLYFFGQFLSLCGTWMQNLAVGWLVYRLTKSAWMLGLVSFASLAPTLLFGLPGGYLADKCDRRKIILLAQGAGLLQSALLCTLVMNNSIEVWQIIALIAAMGTASAFEIPARQSLIANLVPRRDLVNAVSLNASMFNGARMIGPAVGGLLITWFGEGICFLLNSVSYLAVIMAVASMKLSPGSRQHPGGSPRQITDGIRFVAQSPGISSVLLLVMALSLFGMPFLMLLPVVAKDILHGEATLFGTLSACSGAGALCAALLLANRGASDNLRKTVGVALIGFSIALAAFAHSTNVVLSLLLVIVVAFCMTFQLSGSQSIIQLAAPDHLRGKVMSIYMMVFMGMGPAGSLLAGWLARQWGVRATLSICAFICGAAALIYLFLPAAPVRAKD